MFRSVRTPACFAIGPLAIVASAQSTQRFQFTEKPGPHAVGSKSFRNSITRELGAAPWTNSDSPTQVDGRALCDVHLFGAEIRRHDRDRPRLCATAPDRNRFR